MVTKNNDYVGEGPNNDQMKYLCSEGVSVNIAGPPHIRLPSASTVAGPAKTSTSRHCCLVRRTNEIVSGCNRCGCKSYHSRISSAPSPIKNQEENQPLKALRSGGTSPAYRGASS